MRERNEKGSNPDQSHRKKEEVGFMNCSIGVSAQEVQLLQAVQQFVESLKREMDASNEEDARKDALEALRRTGVVDQSGNVKEKIVSWE